MGEVIIPIMFFAVPIASVIYFIVSLVLFLSARSENKQNPNDYSKAKLKNCLVSLIISSVIAFVVLAVVGTIIALLYMALAYM